MPFRPRTEKRVNRIESFFFTLLCHADGIDDGVNAVERRVGASDIAAWRR